MLASFTQAELKIFFNIQGVCLITAIVMLLITEHFLFFKHLPISNEIFYFILSLLAIIGSVQIIINLQATSKAFIAGIAFYALTTVTLLSLIMMS